jgi:aminoglycoside/choline kinase family phosphotransferase
MNEEQIIDKLKNLYESFSEITIDRISTLPLSGSDRRYFRFLDSKNKSVLAVYNCNIAENEAYFYFSSKLKEIGIKVPELLLIADERTHYLIEDLGDNSLLQFLENDRKINGHIGENIINLYKKALKSLAVMQLEVDEIIDYSHCFQSKEFDKKTMLADCNLFKYWYLFPTQTAFEELALERDFEQLCEFLYKPDEFHFMYRDFQARNIMVKDNEVYFIDFQGGRKGPLQYDIASLLFQAKAQLPENLRENLLDYYLDCLEEHKEIDRIEFKKYYYGYVLLRCLQVLGAYGFKGFFQRKEHFLQSITYALKNLEHWLSSAPFQLELPELRRVLTSITERNSIFPEKENFETASQKTLKLHIRSFSYKRGLPEDLSEGHGQGYIFDCRILHNPGRYESFKTQSGLDRDVIEFLEREGEMHQFLKPVLTILEMAIDKYLNRNFEYLGINFGCTGGQHRSVYAAEAVARMLQEKYSNRVNILLDHRESEYWGRRNVEG